MTWNSPTQNSNGPLNNSYSSGGYEYGGSRKKLLIAGVVVVALVVGMLLLFSTQPQSQESKYIQSATAAARKYTPNAEVSSIKVAGGFASAIVNDPTTDGQANAGNTTVFKVNADGSMKQLASGSYFSPLDFLQLGIPLATQAKLTGSAVSQVKQSLADLCSYNDGSAVGYSGFEGSFNPNGWQIDSATLSSLEQKLSDKISSLNASANQTNTVICVNATQKNSNATTDTTTYISTFMLRVQFITADGTLSDHILTFASGPNHYRQYTLDGKDI